MLSGHVAKEHLTHLNPLVVPLQVPVRKWSAGQAMLSHLLQLYVLVVPSHTPVR